MSWRRPQRTLPAALVWVACAALVSSVTTRLPPPAERAVARVSSVELKTHVEILASDNMAGRGLGHAGNRRAELYIADTLRASGTLTAAAGSYFQPVTVFQPTLGTDGHLKITDDDKLVLDLKIGRDFYPLPPSMPHPTAGRVVFAGYGISSPARKYDDYANVDVRGAIVVVLDDAPALPASDSRIDDRTEVELASVEGKIEAAVARGARALVVIKSNPDDLQTLWPESPSVRAASYRLYRLAAGLPVVAVSATAVAPLRAALDAKRALRATLTAGVIVNPITVHNVVGFVEGRDAAGAEMVVVGAHLDHDGIDADGRIYNGADDNASGTAAVLAMAAAFARAAASGERPARAVLFALWNGEEKGSLGAEAFADAPQPARRMIANINLDMVGRATAEGANRLHLLGYTYTTDLARTVLAANDAVGLDIREDLDHDGQKLLQRSDNWAFLKRGIPAVFLTTGLHPEYHTPDDDADRIDYGKLERITKLASRAAWIAADGPAPRLKK